MLTMQATDPVRRCIIGIAVLWALWLAGSETLAQERLPPVTAAGGRSTLIAVDGPTPDVPDRLNALERRLDQVTRANQSLLQNNQALTRKVDVLSRRIPAASSDAARWTPTVTAAETADATVTPPPMLTAGVNGREEVAAPPGQWPTYAGPEGYEWLAVPRTDSSDSLLLGRGRFDFARPQVAGGGSKASGGDPTVEGRAQIIGNRHVGRLELESHYDFDHDGFGWSTKDREYTLGIRGMSQVDARMYSPAGADYANSGLFNPAHARLFRRARDQTDQVRVFVSK